PVFLISEPAGHGIDSDRRPATGGWKCLRQVQRRFDLPGIPGSRTQTDGEERRRHGRQIGRVAADEARGHLLMPAGVNRRAYESATHVAPVDGGCIRFGYVDSATVEAEIVQNRSDPFGDAASLPLARGEEHRNLADDRAIDRGHTPMRGKSRAAANA